MCLNKLLVPLAFSMLFSSGVTAASEVFNVDDISKLETEPTKCFENGTNLTAARDVKLIILIQ